MLKLLLWILLVAASIGGLEYSNPYIEDAFLTENNQVKPLLINQPYSIKIDHNNGNEIFLDIKYRLGQNSSFVIEPMPNLQTWENNICIDRVLVSGQNVNANPVCAETTLNLAPYLKEGGNLIELQSHARQDSETFYIYPRLLGANIISSVSCIGLLAAAAMFLFCAAQRMGLNTGAGLILVLAMAYFCYWLYYYPNLSYTADLPGHLPYTIYMVDNWMHPFDYNGHESFHPPFYYFLGARIFSLFSGVGPINPLTALRAASLGMYMLFCLYGVRTLKLASSGKGMAYYIGCVMIAFWPVAIIKATNINNDIIIYALWGMAFYYVARWFSDHNISGLQIAVALVGIMFMAKSNAWVPGGVVGVCALYGLYSHRVRWRQLFSAKSLMAGFLLIVGIAINFGRIISTKLLHGQNTIMEYFGYPRQDVHPVSYFMQFNVSDFAHNPFVTFDSEPTFLNFFLKSMLYNESSWQHPGVLENLPQALNIILVLWLIATIAATVTTFTKSRQTFDNGFPYFAGAIIPFLNSVAFMVVDRYVFCQNFRYVLPMLVPLVILWLRGMETARGTPALTPLYVLGMVPAILLPTGAIVLYLEQYLHLF